ncbi:hypothetical protein GCM10023191_030670 [Actinoallomurus oryzae]|uniref:DUF2238 domain-containing protein n=1 Tax=Actinoallomurus oryzae TaxID=502180 RepID=A0ABP8PX16_9ACTN
MNRATTWWAALSLAMKAALAGLLLFALAHPHWDRFADKAMGIRAMTYPIAAVLVPVVWSIARRLRGSARYPWDVDALVVAPFVIDVAGNAANLYDTLTWFDDFCHFANWTLVSAAFGAALRRGPALPRWMLAFSCAGLGAIAAILWELAEYATFIMNTDEVIGIYRDTIGDEVLGLSGATVAGVLVAVLGPARPAPAHGAGDAREDYSPP